MKRSLRIQLSVSLAAIVILLLIVFVNEQRRSDPADALNALEDWPLELTEEFIAARFAEEPQLRLAGFSGLDLTRFDLSGLDAAFLARITFDDKTRWPEPAARPEDFDPKEWLLVTRSPGLGVSELHDQGITGRGVVTAIIGQSMRATHKEFMGRIQYHPPASGAGQSKHFQGISTASILAGRTSGIAPASLIHYFAIPQDGERVEHYAAAVEQILALNEDLDPAQRIRLVVISDGVDPTAAYAEAWFAVVAAAAAEGVSILYANNTAEWGFSWGGALPFADRSDPTAYTPARYLLKQGLQPEGVILPVDYRTTAGNDHDEHWVYYGEGGFSLAIPYLAGLLALAWQVDPDQPLAVLIEQLQMTSAVADRGRVVDPAAFIAALEQNSNQE